MHNLYCDALIVGGGPAGSLVACGLSRSGKSVIQILNVTKNKHRPFEILAPSTRKLLAFNRLSEPTDRTAKCRGVISIWSSREPSFHDYELNNAIPGLTIDRAAFHQSLSTDARAAGVNILNTGDGQRNVIERSEKGKISCMLVESGISITADFLIDAAGRQGNSPAHWSMKRNYVNSQIALSVPFRADKWNDCLIVEAVANGWFYVPPAIDGQTQLVFMTDADLLPANGDARSIWLSGCFGETLFIKGIAPGVPDFSSAKGADARFSRIPDPLSNNVAFVGDAALALDPLSGTGTWTALNAAQKLNTCLTANEARHIDFVKWYDKVFKQEKAFYKQTYADAAKRFPGSLFWMRRSDDGQ